jgi:hypothetical protein
MADVGSDSGASSASTLVSTGDSALIDLTDVVVDISKRAYKVCRLRVWKIQVFKKQDMGMTDKMWITVGDGLRNGARDRQEWGCLGRAGAWQMDQGHTTFWKNPSAMTFAKLI